MSEELKTILEAAYIIKERVTLESEFVSVDIAAVGNYPITIHFDSKPDFVKEYVKEPYKDEMHCVAIHEGVRFTWFEDKE